MTTDEDRRRLDKLAEEVGVELDEEDHQPLTPEDQELVGWWRRNRAWDKDTLISEDMAKLIRASLRRKGIIKPSRPVQRARGGSKPPRSRPAGPAGNVRPEKLKHKDTSIRIEDEDVTPKKDLGKDYAGIRHANEIWNEPKGPQATKEELVKEKDDYSYLDAYEEEAEKNIDEYGHPEGEKWLREQYEGDVEVQKVIDYLEQQEELNYLNQPDPMVAGDPMLEDSSANAKDPLSEVDDPMGVQNKMEEVPPEALEDDY